MTCKGGYKYLASQIKDQLEVADCFRCRDTKHGYEDGTD